MATIKIYKIMSPKGKVYYVGQTSIPLCERLGNHARRARKSPTSRFHRWFKRILDRGLEPTIASIENCKNKDKLKREEYWIEYYRKINPKLKNIDAHGRVERSKKAHQVPMVFTPEIRKRMSLAKLGKTGKLCPNSKGVVGYKGDERLEFSCAREAGEYLNAIGIKISHNNISKVISGKPGSRGFIRKTAGGYTWKRN